MRIRNKRSTLAYWCILTAAALLYAVLALADRIWADEAYTFAMLQHSFPEMWRITAADVHPPLYYFAAKLFAMAFGYSQYSLRILSALCYLAVLAIGGRAISKEFSPKAGILFMLLFLLYPYSLEYAVEVRMYSLASLLILLNALCAWRAWKYNRPGDWIGFAAAGIAAAYTHYFALVSAGIIYGLLFLAILIWNRRLFKPWLIASAVTIVLYLPWLKSFAEQLAFKVSNDYWIEPIGIGTIANYALSLLHANGYSLFPVFFGITVLFLIVLQVKNKAWAGLLALSIPVLTALLGIGVSLLIRPIFVVRYLAPCGPLLIFFVALGLSQVQTDKLYAGISAVILVAFVGNLAITVMDMKPQSERIDGAFVSQTAQAEAYVVDSSASLRVSQVLSYYQSETPIYVPDALGADNPYPNKYELAGFDPEEYSVYVVLTEPGTAPEADGFTAEYLGAFPCAYDSVDAWQMTKQ